MKITVKEQTEKTVVIELPYYSKSICTYYKIVREDLIIRATEINDEYLGIQIDFAGLSSALSEERISEEEFNDAYFRIQQKMLNLML